MKDNKLSDLSPKRQREVVQQRIADMEALREHALTSNDSLIWMTLELDAQARLGYVDISYVEDLDDDEIE